MIDVHLLQSGLLPSSEALCSVPSTLVALCLNTGGLARVRDSQALSCFVPIFTTRAYSRALSGDTPSILGSGLDELMRHVPSLRQVSLGRVNSSQDVCSALTVAPGCVYAIMRIRLCVFG